VLTPTGEILDAAVKERHGAGAFNVVQLEHAEAIVAGAEAAGAPAILQLSENTVRFHGALAPLALATMAIARASSAPVAVHLDHATDPALVHEAVALGLGSVMFDASRMSYVDNVAAVAAVATHCHRHGVHLEAELGEIGGKDGVHAPHARTDPGEAHRYVTETGIDALAVAVGTSHAMLTREATLDLDLIARLHNAVPVPLVLHGSSGVPEPDLLRAVEAGLVKINIATHLNNTLTTTIRAHLAAHPKDVDPRRYLGPARDAMAAEVARLLTLLNR
jgi:fructose-bisphosphate aldolase class II